MAKPRPSPARPSQAPTTGEDVFTASILRFLAWARDRTQTLIIACVFLTVLVVGTVYWFSQRSDQLDAAAAELEELQQTILFEDPATAAASVQGYLDRFGGTTFGVEARFLLARVHLTAGEDPDAAVEVLQAVAPDFGSSLTQDATFMLAASLEQAERWDEAVQIYEELVARVDFTFQQKEAGEGLARASLAQGDTVSAVQAYGSILETLEDDDPTRSLYEMRLAELGAREG